MSDNPSLFMAAAVVEISLSWPEILLRLAAVLFLVLLNACFVATEFALISVRRTRIEQLAEDGNKAALSVQRSQKDLDRYLSTSQLGITIASLALGWIGEPTVAALIGPLLNSIPALSSPEAVHTISSGVAFVLITYLHIVLGELAPKSIAILYPERVALLFAQTNELFYRLLAPFLNFLNFSSAFVLRIAGVKEVPNIHHNQISPEELQLLIAASSASGSLDKDEKELLVNVFEFGDSVAIDVMIPRTSIDAIPITATVKEALDEVAETGHTRYPLYDESLDTIRGMVHIKDIVTRIAQGELQMTDSIQALSRPIQFVPENKRISELLTQMQRERQAIVIVIDEFGGTAGLLTMENLIEQIVGNIADEGELIPLDIIKLDEMNAVVQAQTDLEDVNERLGIDLPLSDDYKTLGGFMMYELRKVPEPGESFLFEGIELTVMEMEGPRLERIKVSKRPEGQLQEATTEVPSQVEG
jgi:CBS domain containing-hemolysin-like protein